MVERKRLPADLPNGNGLNGHDHAINEEDWERRRLGYGNRNWAGDGSIRAARLDGGPAPGEIVDRGRPTLYKEEYVEQARKLAELGHTNSEIARFFGVGEQTFRTWLSRWPQLGASLVVGKEVADNRVERSLYMKAVGYHVQTEKVFCSEGRIVRAKTETYFPPDTSAAIMWLKNRRGWTDRAQIEFTPGPSSFADELRDRLNQLEVPNEISLGPGDYKRVN